MSARLSTTTSSTDNKAVSDAFEAALAQGPVLFKANKKVEMFALFKSTIDKAVKLLPSGQVNAGARRIDSSHVSQTLALYSCKHRPKNV